MTLVLLGAAWTFALFAGTTITNVPSVGTTVMGDLGIFPGTALTGFPPGLISGSTYLAGPYACLVVGDVQKAYLNATGQAFNTTLSNIDLGGLTLSPGVYKFDAAAAFSLGQLFFDAKGDADAVWIFQIGSSLGIAGGTSMFFTSGVGNANNVFWAVGSSATIGDGASFIGNIMAYASVSCNGGVTVNGRLLAINGAVTLINNQISFPAAKASSTMTPTIAPSAQPSLVPSPSVSPSISFVPSASTGSFSSKSDSNGLSESDLMLISILGAIGGLVVVGAVVGAILFMSKDFGMEKGAAPKGEEGHEMIAQDDAA